MSQIVRELREASEYYGMVRQHPDLYGQRSNPQVRDELLWAADNLKSRVLDLEVWLDEHAPDELKNPYRGERG